MEERYSRQIAYLGKDAQEKLRKSNVCIIGCGGLGSCSAELLARAGIGTIKLVDRDIVELSNLQRQHLYTEEDLGIPKVVALGRHLRKINSEIRVMPVWKNIGPDNASGVIYDCDLVLDGLDNMESRFALNRACVEAKKPWIFASVIRSSGFVSFVKPGANCLECFIRKIPKTGDNAALGIISPTPTIAASLQANEAIGFLTTGKSGLTSKLLHFNLRTNEFKIFKVQKYGKCKACGKK